LHIHFLDPYQEGDSPIHHIDARVKLVLTIAFIFTIALIPIGIWSIYILLFSLIFSLIILSGVGIDYVLKRAVLAFPFVLAALPLIFTISGPQLSSLTFGPLELTVTHAGMEQFFSIALKSWISILTAILLTSTTQFPDILSAMRAIHVPRFLVAIIGLMWRYIFVLGDEALRLLRARAARSGTADSPGHRKGGTISWRAKTTGGLVGNLFIRSIERSERIYAAMLSRGYDGEVRTIPHSKLHTSNWIVLILGMGLLALLVILSLLIRV
jgi:cobalt/nickel transport system permease protein